MIEEQIKNKLKNYYGDNFFDTNNCVGLVKPLYGRIIAIEMGYIRLGADSSEMNDVIDKIISDHPKESWYFTFYKLYKKSSSRLLDAFYKEGSRIPDKHISDQDIEKYGDYYIRFNATEISYYKNSTHIPNEYIYDFNYPKRQFYIYNCDLLYRKEYAELNESLKKTDSYLLEPLNPIEYYTKKIGYFEYDTKEDLSQKKCELENNMGDLLIEYVAENRIGLVKRITIDNEIIYTTILDDVNVITPTIKPEYISILEKLEVGSKEEFIDIRNKYVTFEYRHITVPMFNISEDRKSTIMDIVDYYKKYENGYSTKTIDDLKVLQNLVWKAHNHEEYISGQKSLTIVPDNIESFKNNI